MIMEEMNLVEIVYDLAPDHAHPTTTTAESIDREVQPESS